MKIAIMGAGAVGCYYGGMLARAGHEVVLIGRQGHVDAIRRHGLLLDTRSFREHVAVAADTDAAAVRGAEIILCCVKSTDTQQAARAMAPHLAADARVLSLQNGVDNAERLQAELPQRVAPAVVYVASEMAGPGHVRHHGRGELVVGPATLTDEQTRQFVAAGIPIVVSDNVAGALWAKLVLNCAWNALSAITQTPYGKLWQSAEVQAVMRDAVAECLAVAAAEGVTLPDDAWTAIVRIAETMPGQLSSTAQDLARQKCSEIDHLNGYVVRRGEAHGIATPVNRTLHALVKVLESGFAA
ncbi:ketopantoate reductase family protein [Azospira restricta]|uniref:2-dehydropantoate 2-reductase n=1 Tax=Azospira restricta TaxID=404405 RepID=A0A974SMR3_9RHOO|nr:ketopantoate reductase family protein [Azospira restricta]QRJ62484.1 ketopantoate reductase family protein [Azospira restricta]